MVKEVDSAGSLSAQVDDSACHIWASVVDDDPHGLPGVGPLDPNHSPQWQGFVGCGAPTGAEGLARGGWPTSVGLSIPGRLASLGPLSVAASWAQKNRQQDD